jgi:hypothetical protein
MNMDSGDSLTFAVVTFLNPVSRTVKTRRWTGQPGQDDQNMTARAGKLEQDNRNKTTDNHG